MFYDERDYEEEAYNRKLMEEDMEDDYEIPEDYYNSAIVVGYSEPDWWYC